MINEYRYNRVEDIYSVPCARRINGEKAITVSGKFAIVQYADGAKTYYKRDKLTPWECIRAEVFTNA